MTQQDPLRLQLRRDDHVVEAGETDESEDRLRRHQAHQAARPTPHSHPRIERFVALVNGGEEDLELVSRVRPIVIHEDLLQRPFILLGKGKTNLENVVDVLSVLLALRHNVQHLLMTTLRRILHCTFGTACNWSTEVVASPSTCSALERVRVSAKSKMDLDTPRPE